MTHNAVSSKYMHESTNKYWLF